MHQEKSKRQEPRKRGRRGVWNIRADTDMRFSSSLSFCRCEDGYPEKSSGLSWSHKASLHQKVAKGPQPHQKNRMPRYQALCVHICLFTCWFYTSLHLEPLIMMTVKTSVCGRRGRGRKFGSECCWDVPISMHRQHLELRVSNCGELQSWKSSPRWNGEKLFEL